MLSTSRRRLARADDDHRDGAQSSGTGGFESAVPVEDDVPGGGMQGCQYAVDADALGQLLIDRVITVDLGVERVER